MNSKNTRTLFFLALSATLPFFDLSLYVKGEYKAARVYRTVLYLDYEAM